MELSDKIKELCALLHFDETKITEIELLATSEDVVIATLENAEKFKNERLEDWDIIEIATYATSTEIVKLVANNAAKARFDPEETVEVAINATIEILTATFDNLQQFSRAELHGGQIKNIILEAKSPEAIKAVAQNIEIFIEANLSNDQIADLAKSDDLAKLKKFIDDAKVEVEKMEAAKTGIAELVVNLTGGAPAAGREELREI